MSFEKYNLMSKSVLVKTLSERDSEIEKLKQTIQQKELILQNRWAQPFKKKVKYGRQVQKLKRDIEVDQYDKILFITQTFDSSFLLPSSMASQITYFQISIDELVHELCIDSLKYCLEFHQNTVVHAHLLLCINDYTEGLEFCCKLRERFTDKSIKKNKFNQKIDIVKQTSEDIERTLLYMEKEPILLYEYNNKPFPQGEYNYV